MGHVGWPGSLSASAEGSPVADHRSAGSRGSRFHDASRMHAAKAVHFDI